MAGELGDISGFLAEAGGVTNLDWLDVDEEQYRQQDTLPKQNLDIIPDLEAAWSHRPEPITNFVPNTGEPTTMLDIVQAPRDTPPEDISRTARLLLMQSSNVRRLLASLRSRYDSDSLRAAMGPLRAILAERGLLGGLYVKAADFPDCANQNTKQAPEFVRRYAPESRYVLAKKDCVGCVHRHRQADGSSRCGIFHKEIQVQVPYTDELAEAVEKTQAAKGVKVAGGPDWKGAAKKLLDKRKGKSEEDFHYRAYLREVIGGRDPGHLAKKFKGSKEAQKDLIDEAGKAASARERIQAALLGRVSRETSGEFTGVPQAPPQKQGMTKRSSDQVLDMAAQLTKENEQSAQEKLAAIKARPIITLLRREMLKGRSERELVQVMKLAFGKEDLVATREQWEPVYREAGLYGAVYSTQDSFDDCRIGADFLNKHSSKARAIVAGDKCESCIFSKVGRCLMYGRKLVKTTSEILTPETVAAVLDEHRMAGRLPPTAARQKWGTTVAGQLKALHRAATTVQPVALSSGMRGVIERGFYGHGARPTGTSDLTKRSILKAASRYMNEGLYGTDLATVLRGRFEVRDLKAAEAELRVVLAEQGLQGIKYIDPTPYDDYGNGCATASRMHRSRSAVKFAKVGDKCASCVHQTLPGVCSVLSKQLVIEPPYIDKAAEQQAILASGKSTEVDYGSLMNNGLSMMAEYQIQNGDGAIELNPPGVDPQVSIEFGNQEVKL